MSDVLQQIRDMQYRDKSGAERLLLSFIRENFPLDVQTLELTPLAVSLNSFNGFMTLADGSRRFFKTHTETDTVITEYYNAGMLSKAGYKVIQPIFKSTEPGKQLLVYDVIDDESVFDLAWRIEESADASDLLSPLTAAQNRADDELLALYQATIENQSAENAAKSPVHQLFYHRLVGGRLDRFYGDNMQITLPDGRHDMATVRRVKWVINGQEYADSLDTVIDRAKQILVPSQANMSIIGHGDAHNGNVFYRKNDNPPSLLYFDPAFAGQHHPLLDLTKPLFHNVFAMWMYFPQEKLQSSTISLRKQGDTWHIDYEYALPPVRQMFLESKVQRVLIPILKQLKTNGQLRQGWRTYLKAALFCCPFLTMNLADGDKFPPEISLLGLAMSIEMGADSSGQRSMIDRTLDEVESVLG
ncbi:MAG: hypothetical protein Q9P01_05890 [Anaerolineae bacterium]|nr:hypothetical protein [Anaerolineae bacterium]MDQ7034368.1 hypothetical protein [Anaerolineae bacterium]